MARNLMQTAQWQRAARRYPFSLEPGFRFDVRRVRGKYQGNNSVEWAQNHWDAYCRRQQRLRVMQRLSGDRESRYTLRIPSHREVTFLPQKRRLLALLFLGEVICLTSVAGPSLCGHRARNVLRSSRSVEIAQLGPPIRNISTISSQVDPSEHIRQGCRFYLARIF